ncbi:ATP-binding protein [Actinoplanes sp. NPDC051861]|uniref:ATP-binding protein n=1 Tax=Actinoplanes sp. NPDC051861 TaxID=3155170 RepID=UPI00342A94F9
MTALPASVPHPGAVELRCWALDSYKGLRRLRAELREVLMEVMGVPLGMVVPRGDVVDRMAVVTTELATNALRHGRAPTVVRLLQVEDRLVVDVADHDVEAEPRFDPDRPPGRGGLGLVLARTFATEVGWYRREGTKHVWASFLDDGGRFGAAGATG